jgi:hypothetical protein
MIRNTDENFLKEYSHNFQRSTRSSQTVSYTNLSATLNNPNRSQIKVKAVGEGKIPIHSIAAAIRIHRAEFMMKNSRKI